MTRGKDAQCSPVLVANNIMLIDFGYKSEVVRAESTPGDERPIRSVGWK